MPRKITKESVTAFMEGIEYNNSNTRVIVESGCAKMYLHGNLIAIHCVEDGRIDISNAGWRSNVTKERLNGIPGVSISQRKGKWYLNGTEWNGTMSKIK